MQHTSDLSASLRPMAAQLEMHVSHACNLTCESCSHFSNQNHKGNVSVEEADKWMSAWSHRMDVATVKLLGGEPTVNPQLARFPPLARKHWPDAEIWIVTNGFFLARHPTLPRVLAETGNCRLFLSVHHEAPAYQARIAPILELLAQWETDYGLSVTIWPAHKRWTRRYTGTGNAIMPFDDRAPRESWQNCVARDSLQLFEGSIWKCPPLAYLQLQKRVYALGSVWDPYLRYVPLSPDCSDEDIFRFLAREDETVCAMCPASPPSFHLKNPLAMSLSTDVAANSAD